MDTYFTVLFIVASIIVIYSMRKDPELVKPAPQTGTITGKLTYGGQPISSAEVKLVQDGTTTATVTSDANGAYKLPAMAIGEYDVIAHLSNEDGSWYEGSEHIILSAPDMVVDLTMECNFVSRLIFCPGPIDWVSHERSSRRFQVPGI
jgi:hypothetical protein